MASVMCAPEGLEDDRVSRLREKAAVSFDAHRAVIKPGTLTHGVSIGTGS
jgi:hypothetical protein